MNLLLEILFVLLNGAAVNAAPQALSHRESNGVGVTPAMGFNNWNSGLSSSAATALSAANYFVSLGLKAAGYEYINIDDTWSNQARSNGLLVPDSTKWPNGIKAVADEIHSLGLKMGLYGDSGTETCSGYPGSQGYETADANTLAGWGIDFWKYDNCNTPSSGTSQTRYTTMSTALKASGRNIYYALCNWGADSVWTWGGSVGNSWRISSDVTDAFSSISSIASNAYSYASYDAPGGFNDWDMLEIGNGGLSAAEERTHFGLWCLAKSPLLIGTDLSKISSTSLAVLLNTELIAINQDSLGKAAAPFTPTGQSSPVSGTLYPYWAGPLSNGVAIGLIATTSAKTFTVSLSQVPGLGTGSYSWKAAYSGNTGSGTSISVSLAQHDMEVFIVYTSSVVTTSTSSSVGGTTTTVGSTSSTSTSAAATSTSTAGTIPKYGQCGGQTWTGSGTCVVGTTCTYSNDYYSQCL